MPLRKPPKSLMTSCMGVICNSFLDVIVELEEKIDLDGTSEKNLSNKEDHEKQPCQTKAIKSCRKAEVAIASYLFSNLPSALLSMLLSEIIKQFACRWCHVIEASEAKTNFKNGNGFW